MLRSMIISLLMLGYTCTISYAQAPPASNRRANIHGKITEEKDGHPLAYAEVAVMKGNSVVTGTIADELGDFQIHNLYPGRYKIVAYILGFGKSEIDTLLSSGDHQINFALVANDIQMEGVTVTANHHSHNYNTSDHTLRMILTAPIFHTSTVHISPMSTPSSIIQQNVPGAVQAPTGEVHIQGQHSEYSYYVDGVPIPETMSEGMTELFDPRTVDRITFLVGDLPAEYSDALSVIDVRTKIPSQKFSAHASQYVGSFNSSGQSLSLAAHTGDFSYFFAGSRKVTDRRIDTPLPAVFHDHGTDLFGFGKVQYIMSPNDILSLDIDQSGSNFQVPYDSTGGIMENDNEQFGDGFQNLIYQHGFGSDGGSGQFYLALSHRQGTTTYTPGATDVPSFFFAGDSIPYNVRDSRLFNVYGALSSISLPEGDEFSFKGGASYFYTKGNENFSMFNGNLAGPQSIQNLQGYDLGAFIQGAYQPFPIFEVDAGVRYDQHHAQGIGTVSQFSPKVKLIYIPGLSTRAYVYYGRLFVPVLIEQLRELTTTPGKVSQITLPVRGEYFELGITHSFSPSLTGKLEGYYTQENPGMDNSTIPGTSIQTAVNIQQIYVRGIQLGLDYSPAGPFSGYFNLAISHAQGVGPTTGGFLPTVPTTTAFDLDHDQRITYSFGLNYEKSGYYGNLIGSYGSGLTNGQINGHVAPHLIFDASMGKSFYFGSYFIKPEFYVANILNHQYLLNGAFFNGANFGAPRTVLFKVSVGVV